MLWVTSTPLLSFLTWSIQKADGILFTYNLLTVLSPILAATTAFILSFFLTRKWLPAFLGGFFFGFSPYEFENLLVGDVNLSFVFLLPLLVLFALIAPHARRTSNIFLAFLLGVLLSAEFLISTEVFAIFILFSFFSMIVFYTTYKEGKLLVPVFKRAVAGLLVSALILSPLIPSLIHGSVYGGGKVMNTYDAGNDLLSLVIPSSDQLLSFIGDPRSSFTKQLGIGYLGIPAILITLVYASRGWKDRQVQFLTYLMASFVIFSLGATLHLFGLCLSPMPWTIAKHLPLIDYAIPFRFILYFWLVFSVVVAYWLANLSLRSFHDVKRLGLVLLAILLLWPKPLPQNKIIDRPIFSQKIACDLLAPGKTLLSFPWGIAGTIDYDQIVAQMCFKAPEGYYGAVPVPFNKWPLNYLLVQDHYKEVSPIIFHQYLSNFDVGLIVVSKTTKNKNDLEALLTSAGFEKKPDIREDPSVEIFMPPQNFIYKKLSPSEMTSIANYRKTTLRQSVIADNRKKLRKVVEKLGFSSDQRFQSIYTWLLSHHILK